MPTKLSQTKLKRFIENAAQMKNDPDFPVFLAGQNDGRIMGRKDAFNWLEARYNHPSVTRDSVEGKAILNIVRELSMHLKELGLGETSVSNNGQ